MKLFSFIKSNCKSITATAAALAATLLTGCGGGSSGDNDITVRPKSLNGLEITFDDAISMQFIRAAESDSTTSGNPETGSIRFTQRESRVARQTFTNGSLDVYWPETTEQLNYIYTPVNSNSGLLQITAARAGYARPNTAPEAPELSTRISYLSSGATVSTTNFNLIFVSNGSTIQSIDMRVGPNDAQNFTDFTLENWVNPADRNPFWEIQLNVDDASSVSYQTTGTVRKFISNGTAGAAVEVNYDSPKNDNGLDVTSLISIETIDQRTIFFTPDNELFEQFSVTHTQQGIQTTEFDEQGAALLFDINNVVNIGSGSYSYDRIPNTDAATYILSDNTGEDGTYNLNFLSIENLSSGQRAAGFYTIQGGIKDGETGYFVIREFNR